MKSNFFSSSSILRKFLVFNLIVFLVLSIFTFLKMLSGLSFCSLECLPIVGIVEAYGVDAPISAAHKRMSHKELSMGVVKDRFDLSETCTGVSHAFSLATVEIPGPVLLELAETANSSTMCGQSNSIVSTPTEDLSSYIDASRSPIIIAGSLCVRENLSKQLETLKRKKTDIKRYRYKNKHSYCWIE